MRVGGESRRVRRCCEQDAIVVAPPGVWRWRATTEAGMRVSRLAPTRKNRSPRIFEQARSASPCSFGPSGLTRTPDTKSRLRDTRKDTEREVASVGPLLGNGLWRCIIIDKQAKLAVKVILEWSMSLSVSFRVGSKSRFRGRAQRSNASTAKSAASATESNTLSIRFTCSTRPMCTREGAIWYNTQ